MCDVVGVFCLDDSLFFPSLKWALECIKYGEF